MAALRPDEETTLEILIDRAGLHAVVEAIVAVCHEKADHVRANWQDKHLAHAWTKNAIVLDRAVAKLDCGA